MQVEKRIHKVTSVPDEYRLIVVSDIHAHQNTFNQLISQLKLKDEDYLVILGDFLEKGPSNYEMLMEAYKLSNRKNTFVLVGNCEAALLELLLNDSMAQQLKNYLCNTTWGSLLREAADKLKLDYTKVDASQLQLALREHLAEEISMIQSFLTAVEFDQFILCHAGIENRQDWEESSMETFLELPFFLDQGHPLKDRYVICGHIPVSNYSDTKIDNSIVINHRRRMISIDGGMGVKDICQLNALEVLKEDDGYVYFNHHADEYERCEVLFPCYPKFDSVVKVAWPDLEIEVLQIGTSFSWCRKLNTKELVFVKNEFIYEKGRHYYCKDDYISYMIEVQEGDQVSLIATYGKYAYVMKDGIVGWIKADRLRKLEQ